MKGIAVKTLFLIVVIAMMIMFSLVIFWNYLKMQNVEATRAACTIKLMNFCERCMKDNKCPNDWDSVEPQGCGDVGIDEPSLDTCKAKQT